MGLRVKKLVKHQGSVLEIHGQCEDVRLEENNDRLPADNKAASVHVRVRSLAIA